MGQKFVPELHDPEYRRAEGQDDAELSDREIRLRFDAAIALLDKEEAEASRHSDSDN